MFDRSRWRSAGDRHLDWDGAFNTRDLGGLRTADGREIRRGAVVRSAQPNLLTASGWAAVREHGIRTIVDLRNDDEREPNDVPCPDDITVVHLPLEDYDAHPEFWRPFRESGQWATPLYYQAFLAEFPEPVAAAVAAVARAEPGGVLVHCAAGRDRTGLVILLLLALVGVAPDDIADDFELSTERVRPLWARLGEDDDGPAIQKIVAAEHTSLREVIRSTLRSLDVDAYLRSAGLAGDELAALRARLLEQPA